MYNYCPDGTIKVCGMLRLSYTERQPLCAMAPGVANELRR